MNKLNDEILLVENAAEPSQDVLDQHSGCVKERHEQTQVQSQALIIKEQDMPSPPYQASTEPITYIWLALLSTICCCPLIGGVALFFSIMSKLYHSDGRHNEARKSSYAAAAFSIAAIVAGLGLLVASIISAIIILTTPRPSGGPYRPPYYPYFPH